MDDIKQLLTCLHWDHAADVLIEIGYPRVHKILPDLLEWSYGYKLARS